MSRLKEMKVNYNKTHGFVIKYYTADTPNYLSTKEAAIDIANAQGKLFNENMLNSYQEKIQRAIRTGKLPAKRLMKRMWQIHRMDLVNFAKKYFGVDLYKENKYTNISQRSCRKKLSNSFVNQNNEILFNIYTAVCSIEHILKSRII